MRTQNVLLIKDTVVRLEGRPKDDDGRYYFCLLKPNR